MLDVNTLLCSQNTCQVCFDKIIQHPPSSETHTEMRLDCSMFSEVHKVNISAGLSLQSDGFVRQRKGQYP